MLTLCRLFNRPADHFSHLTTIRLSGECLNTRINVLGDRGGQAVTQMMAGIAYSCPSLETLDLKMVYAFEHFGSKKKAVITYINVC